MRCKKGLGLLLALLLLLLPVMPAFADSQPEIRNIILLIGDGMGPNHLTLAREHGVDLFMDKNANAYGFSRTRSADHEVTDSAAGGTALACGVRTLNRAIGTYQNDPAGLIALPVSIAEAAKARGMRTGVVTTDLTSGATPSCFSAHTRDRDNEAQITAQQLASGYDLIWGNEVDKTDKAAVEAAGWTCVSTRQEMEALPVGSRSFGQFTGDTWRTTLDPDGDVPMLAGMTEKAIALLSTNNTKGFFLMVEGAHIDKMSHKTQKNEDGTKDPNYPSKVERAVDAMRGFDNAVRIAAEFAAKDGHTVVLVTADHETGDLRPENGVMTYHSGSHTGVNVPVLVFGPKVIEDGEVLDNKEIPARLAAVCGWDKNAFPAARTVSDVLFGDVDFDGSVSAGDARLTLRRSVGLEDYGEETLPFLVSDVDFDGIVTAGDARAVLRASVGLEEPSVWRAGYFARAAG